MRSRRGFSLASILLLVYRFLQAGGHAEAARNAREVTLLYPESEQEDVCAALEVLLRAERTVEPAAAYPPLPRTTPQGLDDFRLVEAFRLPNESRATSAGRLAALISVCGGQGKRDAWVAIATGLRSGGLHGRTTDEVFAELMAQLVTGVSLAGTPGPRPPFPNTHRPP